MSIQKEMSSPIVLIFFNRPELTAKVFARIKEAKPPKLFLISDGPRLAIQGEAEKVTAARNLVAEIDWPCKIFRNYSDINLGCRQRVISGLDWVFSQVDRAVILEDDCLPSGDFFRFTDELLERYSKDERVGSISGTHPLPEYSNKSGVSYFFSRMPMIWGWATWARVWREYDGDIKDWPTTRKTRFLQENLSSKRAVRYWKNSLNGVYKNHIDTWDYQLTYLFLKTRRLAISPSRNLVSNIGFGPSATHTLDSASEFANLPTERLEASLIHPQTIGADIHFDAIVQERFSPNFLALWISRLSRLLPNRVYILLRAIHSRLRSP